MNSESLRCFGFKHSSTQSFQSIITDLLSESFPIPSSHSPTPYLLLPPSLKHYHSFADNGNVHLLFFPTKFNCGLNSRNYFLESQPIYTAICALRPSTLTLDTLSDLHQWHSPQSSGQCAAVTKNHPLPIPHHPSPVTLSSPSQYSILLRFLDTYTG
jgi:hypothetical protein